MKHVDPLCMDALFINRESEEYRRGVRKLEEWHARCRAKRLGLKRKPKSTSRYAFYNASKLAKRKAVRR